MMLPPKSIGYYCIPDFRDPLTLIRHARLAERAGFSAIWVSDHFHPWFHTNAHESQAWIWMAAAMNEVKTIPFGTSVTTPLFRYHPAIVAQSFATIEALYGHRVILGIGAGEAMNELPLGFKWPSVKERRERLIEAVRLIRALWKEEFVDFRGSYYRLDAANLYMRADVPIFMAAFGPKMGKAVGALGDGLITALQPMDYFRDTLFPAIADGAKSVGKSPDTIEKVLEINISYADDYEQAISPARRWKGGLIPQNFEDPIADPRVIESTALQQVSDQALAEAHIISMNPDDHIARIEEAFNTGFNHICLFSSSPDEEKTIEMYAKKVIPYFKSS
jgi:coenzyme F420-dependent glucose-6-phosphate dehydrogenase